MPDGWDEWGRHVLSELKRINSSIEDLRVAHSKLELVTAKEISALKVKAGAWGLLSGFLAAVGAMATEMIWRK